MRPVIRGNASNYNEPDTDPGVEAARDIHAQIIDLNIKRENVIKAIIQYTYLNPTLKVISQNALNNANLDYLKVEEPLLTQQFQASIANLSDPPTDNQKKAVTDTGKSLMYNLNLQNALLGTLYNNIIDVYLVGKYSNARGDLIQNIGQYCSYCEMPLGASLAIEHMLPKSEFPILSLTWNNFILACPSCNSRKNDSPKLISAVEVARITKGNNDVNETEVIQAGYNLLLWPTDTAPRYPSFSDVYHYQLRQVNYDDSGNWVNSRLLDSQRISELMTYNGIFLDSEPDQDILAVIYDPKLVINPSPVLNELTPILAIRPQEITQATNLPEFFVNLLNQRVGMNVLDTNYRYRLTDGFPYRQIQGITLSEQRRYSINTSSPQATVINLDTRQRVTSTISYDGETYNTLLQSKDLTASLQANILPNELAIYLQISPFEWAVEVERPSLAFYDITLVRQVGLRLVEDKLLGYLCSRSAVELLIFPNSPDNTNNLAKTNYSAANETLYLTGMNDRNSRNPEDSDRRVIKRARAFFSAIQTIQNVQNAFNLPSETYPTIRADALESARITMISTGYWSVWVWVILQCMSENSLARNPLGQLLYNINNFPGTRQ